MTAQFYIALGKRQCFTAVGEHAKCFKKKYMLDL